MEKVLNISSKVMLFALFLCGGYLPINANTRVDQSAFIYENTLYTLYDVKPYLIVQQLLDKKEDIVFDQQAYQKAIDGMVQNFIVQDYLNKVDTQNSRRNLKLEKKFQTMVTEKVEQLLTKQGQSQEILKKVFFQEYDKEKFIKDNIAFKVKVGREEAEKYYQEHQQDFVEQNKEDALIKIEQALKKSELAAEYKEWLSRQLARKKIYLFSLE
ncbi:hypothetical protein MRY82_02145 [bacterium]|nr:hypothetical protein [bacterium]